MYSVYYQILIVWSYYINQNCKWFTQVKWVHIINIKYKYYTIVILILSQEITKVAKYVKNASNKIALMELSSR